jgi:hypothetical protein
LIFALVDNPHVMEIDEMAVLRAITLVEDFLKPHLRRLYPRMLASQPSPFDRCREAILEKLNRKPHSYRELRQASSGRYDGGLVKRVLEDLVDAGRVQIYQRTGAKRDLWSTA